VTSPSYGPHRWSAGYHQPDDRFAGGEFTVADLRGARFVDCDFRGVRIVDSTLTDVVVSGWIENVVINGVDVTGYVSSELDRRHPERVQLREIKDADGFRAMWDTVERLWSSIPPDAPADRRVDGEWSLVETLRHLIFITDSWASRTIGDQENPFHPYGLPQTAYRPADAAALGIDLDARPSYAEVAAVRAGRMATVRTIVDGLTDADLGRPVRLAPAPGYPEETRVVAECLYVVMQEECDHYRFTMRDLTAS
jgi:uncharacterized protein YjbI with pentapeptide repeats